MSSQNSVPLTKCKNTYWKNCKKTPTVDEACRKWGLHCKAHCENVIPEACNTRGGVWCFTNRSYCEPALEFYKTWKKTH